MSGMGGTGGGGGMGGTGGGGGASTGDPHLITADGLAYDFQAAGEFVLFSGPEMTAHVRLQHFGSGAVSIQTAVAVSYGGDRIGVYLACPASDTSQPAAVSVRVQSLSVVGAGPSPTVNRAGPCEPHVLLNGIEVAVETGRSLPGGARIAPSARGYSVASPDGSVGVEIRVAASHLNVRAWNPDAPDLAVGLLRGGNGNPHDDIVTRTGQTLFEPVKFREFYDLFGESWRISPAESLFDYQPGESTDTFTDRAFPPFRMTLGYLVPRVRDAANTVCQAAGVPEGYWRDSCTMDVALTSDSSFATGFPRETLLTTPLAMTDDADSLARGAKWAGVMTPRDAVASSCHCSLPGIGHAPSGLALFAISAAFPFCIVRRRKRALRPIARAPQFH